MTDPHRIEKRRHLTFPDTQAKVRKGNRWRNAMGTAALPAVLGVSWLLGGPGVGTRLRTVPLAARALRAGNRRLALDLLIFPMDSFRYFELAFARRMAANLSIDRYLDVSSPRLVPLMLLDARLDLTADLINPIATDLVDTETTADSLGLRARCRTQAKLLEETSFADATFDLVTSISVVEHIPDDTAAIRTMWRLLKPGGTLILTVPCAARAVEEYTTLDEYGLFAAGEDGSVFWQRYYDADALEQRIWSVTGKPTRIAIHGEKRPGTYDRNVQEKRVPRGYAYWYEPLMMAREFRSYSSVDALPGMGVIGMCFTKPAGSTA